MVPGTTVPDSKVHGANMGPIWGWQDPGGPHVGPMNLAIWGGNWISMVVHDVLKTFYTCTLATIILNQSIIMTLWCFLCCLPEQAAWYYHYWISGIEIKLTHWGRVMHWCVSKLTSIVSDNGLSPDCQIIIWTNAWVIINWTLRNKFQLITWYLITSWWNLNRNSYIFIEENAFENVVWKMGAIFISSPMC